MYVVGGGETKGLCPPSWCLESIQGPSNTSGKCFPASVTVGRGYVPLRSGQAEPPPGRVHMWVQVTGLRGGLQGRLGVGVLADEGFVRFGSRLTGVGTMLPSMWLAHYQRWIAAQHAFAARLSRSGIVSEAVDEGLLPLPSPSPIARDATATKEALKLGCVDLADVERAGGGKSLPEPMMLRHAHQVPTLTLAHCGIRNAPFAHRAHRTRRPPRSGICQQNLQ